MQWMWWFLQYLLSTAALTAGTFSPSLHEIPATSEQALPHYVQPLPVFSSIESPENTIRLCGLAMQTSTHILVSYDLMLG